VWCDFINTKARYALNLKSVCIVRSQRPGGSGSDLSVITNTKAPAHSSMLERGTVAQTTGEACKSIRQHHSPTQQSQFNGGCQGSKNSLSKSQIRRPLHQSPPSYAAGLQENTGRALNNLFLSAVGA